MTDRRRDVPWWLSGVVFALLGAVACGFLIWLTGHYR